MAAVNPDVFAPLGDNQYFDGTYDKYMAVYDKAFGKLKSVSKPIPGNHEYKTAGVRATISISVRRLIRSLGERIRMMCRIGIFWLSTRWHVHRRIRVDQVVRWQNGLLLMWLTILPNV